MESREALKKLREEKQKGASYCAHLALNIFFDMESAENPLEMANELLQAKGEMAPIVQIATRCLDHFKGGGSLKEWLVKCQKMKQMMEEAPKKMAHWLSQHPESGRHVMTISYSKSVFDALIEVAKSRPLQVAITEGRPLNEGRLFAKRLAYAGLPVTLGVDGAALTLLETCDALWLGADAVGKHYFINKIGTRALVLGAKVMGKPVFVLADPLKEWPEDREWHGHSYNSDEVCPDAKPPLTIINPYFEKIPLEWVTLVSSQAVSRGNE